MNAKKIVASTSEVVLRGLLEGQPPELIADRSRELRIRQASRWAGPEASRAPFVVMRTAPDGEGSIEMAGDLIAAGKLYWDADELAFVSQPDDSASYTIPGDDEDLSEVLGHRSVPESARDGLREHLARTGPSPEASRRFLMAVRTELHRIIPGQPAGGKIGRMSGAASGPLAPPRDRGGRRPAIRLAAREASCGGTRVIALSRAADGHEIGRVHLRRGADQCTIELTPPFPPGGPAGIVLMVAGRPIEPVVPFDKYGCACVRYGHRGGSRWEI